MIITLSILNGFGQKKIQNVARKELYHFKPGYEVVELLNAVIELFNVYISLNKVDQRCDPNKTHF